jgi:hypothetical protein
MGMWDQVGNEPLNSHHPHPSTKLNDMIDMLEPSHSGTTSPTTTIHHHNQNNHNHNNRGDCHNFQQNSQFLTQLPNLGDPYSSSEQCHQIHLDGFQSDNNFHKCKFVSFSDFIVFFVHHAV